VSPQAACAAALVAAGLALGCSPASATIARTAPPPETPTIAPRPAVQSPDLEPTRAAALRVLGRPEWIAFNQHEIEDLWLAAGAFDAEERRLVDESARTAAAYYLTHEPPNAAEVHFEDTQAILRYVFESVPPVAIVYPTEMYYYFSFPLRERMVAGNLRFVDAEQGILHIGYFDKAAQSRSQHAALSKADGVVVQVVSQGSYRVTYRDREVLFILAQRSLRCGTSPKLLRTETCITGVLDDSGIPMELIYDGIHHAFFFVLNEAFPPIDPLVPIEGGGNRYLYSRRTDFVFFNDVRERRKLLVAVAARNVYENNYFDGPFDQVPPRLELKGKLEAAYPYLKSDPIDAHGNFLNREGQRVAISPYLDYQSLDEAVAELKSRERRGVLPAQKWAALTYESKRDFHKTLAARAATAQSEHRVYMSQGWPANHYLQSSNAWPAEHRQAESATWPANADASGKLATGNAPAVPAAPPGGP
jgi:hypothetical protein